MAKGGASDAMTGKKRPRRDEAQQLQADAGKAAGSALAATGPPKHKHKKRRKSKAVDESQLNPEELERRRVQRELRELAVKLRTEGTEYKPQKHKRKLFLESGAGSARRERKKEKTEQKSKIWVVVLPIFWKQREDEMEAVMVAAKKVEKLLSGLGVRVVVDTNNEHKPGERMKHWETLGVPLRIEIGPQDVKRGSCVVAQAGEAGTVAKKTTLKMSHKLAKKVRVLLQEAGAPVQAPAERKATEGADGAEGAEDEEQGSDAKGEDEEEEEEEEEEEGEEGSDTGEEEDTEARKDSGAEAGSTGADGGGDAMDEFDLDVEAEEDTLTLSKKELAKKRRQEIRTKYKDRKKRAKAAKATAKLPTWEDDESKKAKKPAKVVNFT